MLGNCDGKFEGATEGSVVGCWLGSCEGRFEGAVVGSVVGCWLGSCEGRFEGATVGDCIERKARKKLKGEQGKKKNGRK